MSVDVAGIVCYNRLTVEIPSRTDCKRRMISCQEYMLRQINS